MTGARLRSLAAPTAFLLLTTLLALFGRIPLTEALMLGLAVLAGFVPGTLRRPAGWKRQIAELLLLPAAGILTLFPQTNLRLMLLPPILGLASWAAWWAGCPEQDPDGQRNGPAFPQLPSAAFGLSIVLLSLVGKWTSLFSALVNMTSGLFLASALAFLGPAGALLGALIAATTDFRFNPLLFFAAYMLLRLQRRPDAWKKFEGIRSDFQSLLPLIGGLGVFLLALSAWGMPPLGLVFPHSSWVTLLGIAVIAGISLRFPPAAAGALGVLACLLLGPPIPPIQEGGANISLDSTRREVTLRAGNGEMYGLEIALEGDGKLPEGATAAWILLPHKRIPLRVGRDLPPKSFAPEEKLSPASAASPPAEIILRPPALKDGAWKLSLRKHFKVAHGILPRVLINRKIRPAPSLRILAAGPEIPALPRDWNGEHWLWAAAGLLALIQLLSGLWKKPGSGVPWIPLIAGLLVNRAAIEPLHLLGERYSVDLALAAILIAWIPAASSWSRRRRFFLPAFLLLGSLAFATAHLTPPLWGDEPYHLALMESVLREHSLNPAPYLVGGGATRELILSTGHLFHSPVLAFLLLPGYAAGGRAGALLLLAFYGALALAILLRAIRNSIDLKPRNEYLLLLVLLLSYPLSSFIGQIWPAVVGILCTSGALLLLRKDAGTGPSGIWSALALAAFSGAVKTRLALVTFPVALSPFRGHRRSLRFWPGLSATMIASLGVGWFFLGHPLGPFRRLRDLIPTDPVLAGRVLLGLFFDAAGGLLWTAPFWIIAILLLPRLWREGRASEKAMILGAAATVFLLLPSGEWYGGGSPPARYLVPLLPLVAFALARLLEKPEGLRRLLFLLAPPSFFAWWLLSTRPHLSINPGDGRWYFSAIMARAFQADADSLFPSFLHPRSASIFVPIAVSLGLALLWMIFSRRPGWARHLTRMGAAFWIMLATAFTTTLLLRGDRVVEAEAPQVRRHGGESFPAQGVPQRWAHPVGWSLKDGNSIDFPLHVDGNEDILLIAQLRGSRRKADISWNWDHKTAGTLSLKDGIPEGGLILPGPGTPGKHRLSLSFEARPGTTLLLDRIETTENHR